MFHLYSDYKLRYFQKTDKPEFSMIKNITQETLRPEIESQLRPAIEGELREVIDQNVRAELEAEYYEKLSQISELREQDKAEIKAEYEAKLASVEQEVQTVQFLRVFIFIHNWCMQNFE